MVKQGTTDTRCSFKGLDGMFRKYQCGRVGEHRERSPTEALLLPSLGLCKTWPAWPNTDLLYYSDSPAVTGRLD